MWIFTKYGFYSVVCARKSGSADPNELMIRARERRHLQNLIDRFEELKGSEIKKTSDRDYRYRLFVGKEKWVAVLSALAQELDYFNFKSEAGRNREAVGNKYVDALHEVWEVMYRLQKGAD